LRNQGHKEVCEMFKLSEQVFVVLQYRGRPVNLFKCLTIWSILPEKREVGPLLKEVLIFCGNSKIALLQCQQVFVTDHDPNLLKESI